MVLKATNYPVTLKSYAIDTVGQGMEKARRKPTNGFDKNRERAREAGRKGGLNNVPLTKELIDIRMFNTQLVEQTISKYLGANIETLKQAMQDPNTLAIDLVVIKILTLAIQEGDERRLNFLLERTVGRVKHEVDLNAKVGILTLHDALISKLEGSGQEPTT
jgi:general stress protein YciG